MIQEDRELRNLNLHIKHVLKKDFYKNRVLDFCPICGSNRYIKYGKYNEIQRYKCKKCGKTFSKTTNSLWSHSKKDPRLWLEFIELMIEKKSLRFCAKKLNINLLTAFYWRHKILYGLSIDGTPSTLKGVIYMTKMIMPESLKGCRNIEIHNNIRDWTKNIWIIAAKGDEDSIFAKPVFKGYWDPSIFRSKVYSKIEKKSYLVAYGDRYIEGIAKIHNKKQILKVKDQNSIRYFIQNLKTWLEVYHGIATKYLQRYLSLFILFNLDKLIDYMDLMYHYLYVGNRFVKIDNIRNIKNYMY